MKYKIMLMFLRLARVFVADFHALVVCKIRGMDYKEAFDECWIDQTIYWDELNEEEFEE